MDKKCHGKKEYIIPTFWTRKSVRNGIMILLFLEFQNDKFLNYLRKDALKNDIVILLIYA